MDNVKVKKSVSDATILINELVGEGKLDGDQAKRILYDLTEKLIREELQKDMEVV